MTIAFLVSLLSTAPLTCCAKQQASCRYIFNAFPAAEAVAPQSLASVEGGRLETLEGSIWRLSEYDCSQASYWLAQEPLLITQNGSWFSPHPYRIVNQARGSSAEADLLFLPAAPYVSQIDLASAEVALSDGTAWRVFSEDLPLVAHWAPGEPVAVGINSGEELEFNALLINGEAKTHVRTILK